MSTVSGRVGGWMVIVPTNSQPSELNTLKKKEIQMERNEGMERRSVATTYTIHS